MRAVHFHHRREAAPPDGSRRSPRPPASRFGFARGTNSVGDRLQARRTRGGDVAKIGSEYLRMAALSPGVPCPVEYQGSSLRFVASSSQGLPGKRHAFRAEEISRSVRGRLCVNCAMNITQSCETKCRRCYERITCIALPKILESLLRRVGQSTFREPCGTWSTLESC